MLMSAIFVASTSQSSVSTSKRKDPIAGAAEKASAAYAAKLSYQSARKTWINL